MRRYLEKEGALARERVYLKVNVVSIVFHNFLVEYVPTTFIRDAYKI